MVSAAGCGSTGPRHQLSGPSSREKKLRIIWSWLARLICPNKKNGRIPEETQTLHLHMDWASVVEHLYQQNFCSCCPLVCPSGNSTAQRHWGVTAFPSTIDMARLPWKPWQIGTSSNSLSNELMIMCWHPFFIFVRLAIIKVYWYKRSDIIELELMPVAFNEMWSKKRNY